MKNLILPFMVVFSLASCDKGEIPVPPREPSGVITTQVEMGSDYRNVLYYNLKTNSVIRQHLKTDWDLGFETGEDGWRVILNSSKGMASAQTNFRFLKDVSNTDGVEWRHDASSGNLDSTAVGDWKNNNQVYVLDRGYDLSGGLIGIVKLRIEETTSGYRIHFADVSSTDSSAVDVEKDDMANFSCLSLEGEGTVVDIEPNKDDWHLKFTQYTHIFIQDGVVIPYGVTGVLLNPHQMQAYETQDLAFDTIDLDIATSFMYSDAVDILGYDWKEFNFDLGTYTIESDRIYLLRNSEGIFWKLHFIDFYTQNGEKGAPMFELQEL
jgi:hypothetical protein